MSRARRGGVRDRRRGCGERYACLRIGQTAERSTRQPAATAAAAAIDVVVLALWVLRVSSAETSPFPAIHDPRPASTQPVLREPGPYDNPRRGRSHLYSPRYGCPAAGRTQNQERRGRGRHL